MQINFLRSSVIISNERGPCFITLHSGPSLGSKPNRDEHAEAVASICVEKFGGRAIISTTSRSRLYGVDLNRDIPAPEKALEMYPVVKLRDDREAVDSYLRRFGWVAENKSDYLERLQIYKEFWDFVEKSGDFLVFVHSNKPRLRACESIMDFATFENIGVRKDVLERIVEEINKEYADFLKKIRPKYFKAILYEQEIITRRLQRTFHSLRPWKMKGLYKDNYISDLEMAKKYGVKPKEWTRKGLYNMTKQTLNLAPIPRVTVEQMFSTLSSHAPKKLLGKKVIVQLEINQFICKSYANQTSDMLMDILRAVRDAQK